MRWDALGHDPIHAQNVKFDYRLANVNMISFRCIYEKLTLKISCKDLYTILTQYIKLSFLG